MLFDPNVNSIAMNGPDDALVGLTAANSQIRSQ